MEKTSADMRVIRTKGSFRKAFCDMILEMDYSDIYRDGIYPSGTDLLLRKLSIRSGCIY